MITKPICLFPDDWEDPMANTGGGTGCIDGVEGVTALKPDGDG